MIALLVIFILIFVLSITNIIVQIIGLIGCSKNEKVTVVKIPVDLLSELGFVKEGEEN